MPVEYKLMTFLPKAFPIFSPFSFSSRCLYSAYVLLMVLSLALPTLSCVHLFPNKCALPLSITLFYSSCLLSCSMPSFGVSTTSPKNSSSFNMSLTSVIIFIKCWNRHHMKNHIRYEGNINNTSVIIFLKSKFKNYQQCYFGWENLQWGFCCCSSFHFCSSYFLLFFICWCSSFCCCSSFVNFLHSHFLFDISPYPSVDYHQVFTPILYFQPSPSQSDSRHFHFQPFRYLLTASATVLSGHFLPTGIFYLALLHRHLTSVYQGFTGSRQFFLEVCRASY